MQRLNSGHRVVILGGGAGGLELAARLGGRDDCEIVLIDRNLEHAWKPRLHEMAAGTLASGLTKMSYAALALRRGFRFELGEVAGINCRSRRVHLQPLTGTGGEQIAPSRDIRYDYLVIALGGVTPDMGVEGVADHSFRIEDYRDAERFLDCFTKMLYALADDDSGNETRQIVIVGSGATGIELAAHLRESSRALLNEHSEDWLHNSLHITILEAAETLMPGAEEEVRHKVVKRLEALDIGMVTGAMAESVTANAVTTKSGDTYSSDLTVWATGLVGPDILSHLDGLQTDDDNRVLATPQLLSRQDSRIYALGDAASMSLNGKPLPPTAQVAHQAALYLAHAIPRRLRNKAPGSFHYRERGRLLSLAEGGAVGRIRPASNKDFIVRGRFARAAYHTLYRQHQWVVLGKLRGGSSILADWLSGAPGPALKLH